MIIMYIWRKKGLQQGGEDKVIDEGGCCIVGESMGKGYH